MSQPNAIVEYVNESREVVAVDRFYDPGLDRNSEYTRDWMERERRPFTPHLAYGCGRPLTS